MFKSGPNYNKLKTNLRLVINRLKLLEKKKTEMATKARKEIADYISGGKEDRARIRVEHIIREDYMVEAMELLEMYCDLLLARFGLITSQKELDAGLEESIASLMWATPRLQADIAEFKNISEQFMHKYGKEFADACKTNALNNVSEKVMHRLGVQAPPKILVERYMMEIAKTYNVAYEPDSSVMAEDEIFAAENLLINLDDKKGGGGGGGGGMIQPIPAAAYPPPGAAYPPPGAAHPPSGPSSNIYSEPGVVPPPIPAVPPAGPSYPPSAGGKPFDYPSPSNPAQEPPPTHLYDNSCNKPPAYPGGFVPPPAGGFAPPPAMPSAPVKPNTFDTFPDLPAVPNSTLPDAGASVGGEDVDFDDLTKRFEELKKKK